MLAQLRGVDGSAAVPSYSFTSEIGSGLYRAGTNDVRLAVGGVDALKLVSGGLSVPNVIGPITMSGGTTAIQVTLAGGFLVLQGNQAAGQVSTIVNPADVVARPTTARTAGFIFQVQRQDGNGLLGFDYQGLMQLQNPAAIQPATIWTAIAPGTGWTAGGGLAYWKDADGIVHFKGNVTGALGSAAFTTLPAGFRPAATRAYSIPWGGTAPPAANDGFYFCQVLSSGVVSAPVNSAGTIWYLDGVSFLAEA